MKKLFALIVSTIAFTVAPNSLDADPYPPLWSGGTGGAVHFPPVSWPSEPASPLDCGDNCGDWKPYTRFQNEMADPRNRDPSNGGTSPQSYVNVSSSCSDTTQPSIYYYLHQGATPADDVLMFRWRVESAAHNYATGPNAGNFSSNNPWSSALWTVFFDLQGSGYRSLAAHLDGSSGSPSEAVDRLAGIWANSTSQSLDYINDPNIYLLSHNPTAFVGATNKILNFQNSMTPVENWPNGSSETRWDYGNTRATLVSKNSCTEYFVDYQIPIAMLDASGVGGPALTRDTPIAMMFCTANSLNNPLQKDCAVSKEWLADPSKPAPFGDYISFNQTKPYSQPIISAISATPPASCPGSYSLSATVQDTLALENGDVVSSVQTVDFYYWFDANGDGEATAADSGSSWVKIPTSATLKSGSLNNWLSSWDASSLSKGKYLIGAQAVDDNTKVDDGMTPSGIDNRTFSYLAGDSANEIYIDGSWKSGQQVAFPTHSPAQSPVASENWFGNPAVTGSTVALISTAINVCGVAPTIAQTVSDSEVGPSDTLSIDVTITNPASNAETITVSDIVNTLPDGFAYVAISASGATTAEPTISGQTLTWTLSSPISLLPSDSTTLTFDVTASSNAGLYNNTASATTSFGNLVADPAAIIVDAANVSLTITPDTYSVAGDGVDEITFTINYSNDSNLLISNAAITAAIAANSNYVTCTGGASCSESGGTVTWTLSDLTAGATGSVSYTITVANTWPTASLTATANFAGTDSGSNAVTDSASVTVAVTGIFSASPADFTLTKTASAAQVAPGGSLTYTISYSNYGGTAADSVVITDTLPAGVAFTSCTGGCSESSGVVTWNLGTIAGGGAGSVTVTVAVDNPFTSPNPATNTASIDWTGGTTVATGVDVGITGQACSDYYFSDTTGNVGFDGVERLALISPVPTAGDVGASVTVTAPAGSYVEALSFYQNPAAPSDTPFPGAGNISTEIYIDRNNGPSMELRSTVYDYDSVTGTRTQLGQQLDSFGGSTKGLLTVTVPTTGTLAKNHRLLWVFEAQSGHPSNSFDVQFQYAGTVANTVSGSGSTVALSNASFCVTPPANLLVTATADANQVIETNTTLVTYTLDYTNTGSADATNSNLISTLPTGFTNCEYSLDNSNWSTCSAPGTPAHTFALSTVTGGSSGTVYIRGNAPASSSSGDTLTNTNDISSDQTATQTATVNIPVVAAAASGTPAIVVDLSVNDSTVAPGDSVVYTATVVNVGTANATNVVLSNALPVASYYTYSACSNSCSVVGSDISWNIGTLAPGASQAVTYTMLAGSTGLSAGVTAINDDVYADADSLATTTSAPATVYLNGNPQLSLAKTATPNSGLNPGDTIHYTITVTNSGSSDATSVQVTDPIPVNTFFAGNITTSVGSASFDAVNNRVVFDSGTLAPAANATVEFDVTVSTDVPSGNTTITNTATSTAGNAGSTTASENASVSATASFTITHTQAGSSAYPTAQLTATATSTTDLYVDNPQHFTIGQSVLIGGSVYTITAISSEAIKLNTAITASSGTNVIGSVRYGIGYLHSGDADAINTVLTHDLPVGLLYYAATPSASSAPTVGTNGDLTWNLGTVEPGQSGSFDVLVFPDGTLGALTSTVSIVADNATLASASVVTNVGGISISKSSSTPVRNAGDIASYTIVVSNSLSSAVNGVTVTDTLPQGFTYRSSSALVGGIAIEPTFAGADTAQIEPSWSGLTIPANSAFTITFDADIDADTGAGVYQNYLAIDAPAGVGVQQFDPLNSPDDDVTVLAADEARVSGTVFYRTSASGNSYVPGSDTPLANVTVEIYQDGADCNNLYDPNCFITTTNTDGEFSKIVPSGDWRIKAISGSGDLNASWAQTIGDNDVLITIAAQDEIDDQNGFVTVPGSPAVSDISKTLVQDTTLTFAASDFTGAFTDSFGGSSLDRIQVLSLPSNGTLTLSGTPVAINDEIDSSLLGNLVYTPTTGYTGGDSFQWNGNDGIAYAGAAADVLITITSSSAPGTVVDIDRTINQNASLTFTSSDFINAFTDNLGGNNLNRIRVLSLPSNGTLTLSGTPVAISDEITTSALANLVYTPNTGYSGADSFQWNGSDGVNYASAPADVNITITANPIPGSVADINRTITQDSPLTFSASDFSGAYTDGNGGNNLDRIQVLSLPSNGTLTLSGSPVAINDEITTAALANLVYTPNTGYSGADSFQWNGSDGAVYASSPANVAITINAVVTPPPSNPGTVTDFNRSVNQGDSLPFVPADFIGAFTDGNGGNNLVHIRIDSLPVFGTLSLNGVPVLLGDTISAADLGNLLYTPGPNYNGSDSFDWNAFDGTLYASNSATTAINVLPGNQPPVAQDENVTLAPGETLTRTAAQLGDDPDGDPLTLVSAKASKGSVSIINNELVYTPDPNFSGIVEIEFLISDGNGGYDKAVIIITIEGNSNGPTITPPPDITVDANALYTKVDLGVARAEDRFGNPLPVSLVDGVIFYEPGINRVFWEAVDGDGNRSVAMQTVRVLPLISIEKDKIELEGETVSVGVYFNGLSPVYPVTIPYTVTGTSSNSDHNLVDGEITITSGTEGKIEFSVVDDGVGDDGETVVITLDSALNLGSKFAHTMTIVEGNVAPVVDVVATQDGARRNIISRQGGLVELQAIMSDANAGDSHTYQWQSLSGAITDLDAADIYFTIDPQQLAVGLYFIELVVTDDGTPSLSDTVRIYLDVVDTLPTGQATDDSDFDLIPDDQEGLADDDNDGVLNYLDSRDECNVLLEKVVEQDAFQIEGDPGVCLIKGSYTAKGETGGAQISRGDVVSSLNQISDDTEATNVGGIFDFIALNLPVAGQAYNIVIPQRLPIPENPVYRKFANGVWGFFDETGENSLASAPGEQGFCPPPGGSQWQPGLNVGHWCVQLTIVEGGPNDDDGLANGMIVDPGGVGVMLVGNTPPTALGMSDVISQNQTSELDVLSLASDTDGDTLSMLGASVDFGSVVINNDGSITFTPPAGFVGDATITYTISDGNGGVVVATAIVTVQPLNQLQTKGGGGAMSWLSIVALGLLLMVRYFYTANQSAVQKISSTLLVVCLLGVMIFVPEKMAVADHHVSHANENESDDEQEEEIDYRWYAKGNLGLTRSTASTSDIDNQFQNAGLNASVINFDDADIGYSAAIGYQLTDSWAIEGGYLDLGEFLIDIQGSYSNAQAFFDSVEKLHPESAKGLYGAVDYRWLFSEDWHLHVRGGLYQWSGDYTTTLNGGSQVGDNHQSDLDLFVGAAINYAFKPRWEFALGIDRFDFDNHGVNFLHAGLIYRFGESEHSAPVETSVPFVVQPETPAPEEVIEAPVEEVVAAEMVAEPPAISEEACQLFNGSLEGVTFATASAELTDAAKDILRQAAKVLSEYPDLTIEVQAHTDSVGSEASNLTLSDARATSVREFFIEQGISSERMISKGYGEAQPVADNATAEGRAQNRRVDLVNTSDAESASCAGETAEAGPANQ